MKNGDGEERAEDEKIDLMTGLHRKSMKIGPQADPLVENFLNDVFDSIQDGISILDKDMNIVRVNKAMEKWYAFP